VIKLLAVAKRQGNQISARVHPAMIPKAHPMASIQEAYNGIYVVGNAAADIMISGQGAGALPTASAIVSDVMNIIKSDTTGAIEEKKLKNLSMMPMEENLLCYYVHVKVEDTYGVLSAISAVFGKNQVSILAMSQEAAKDGEATLVFITHLTREGNLAQAVAEMRGLKMVRKVANVIRIEALADSK